MPKSLMEALCGKESEHWKKAWEFEMYRATLKQTWEDVQEEEYAVGNQLISLTPSRNKSPKV
jgi:hypothetical protein